MNPNASGRKWLFLDSALVGIGFGGFLLWAFFAPLNEGVVCSGTTVVEDTRNSVQHLEGGIISAVYAKEGDTVEEKDKLFDIVNFSANVRLKQVLNELATLLASSDRLSALRNSEDQLIFHSYENWNVSENEAQTILKEQLSLFNEQKERQFAKINVLQQQIERLIVGSEQRRRQQYLFDQQIDVIEKELDAARHLLQQKLEVSSTIFRLEREKATLESERSELLQRILETDSQVIEVQKEIQQSKADFREYLSSELLNSSIEIAKANEEIRELNDVVLRSEILAPVSGKILNQNFSTVGGVIRPGEVILEIVPEVVSSWAMLRIAPQDRDAVQIGSIVRIKLVGLKSWNSKEISATVRSVSADLKEMPQTGEPFFEVRAILDQDQLEAGQYGALLPGLPVQAFITKDSTRTLADYLFEPIYAHWNKGMADG